MKRAKAKTATAKPKATRAKSVGKPVELAAVREQIVKLVGSHAVGMVKTTIGEVDKGRFLAMKLLFEMVGLYPVAGEEESPAAADSMAKVLLRRLQIPDDPVLETSVTKDCELDITTASDDTVK